jgi:hypothetical protein
MGNGEKGISTNITTDCCNIFLYFKEDIYIKGIKMDRPQPRGM